MKEDQTKRLNRMFAILMVLLGGGRPTRKDLAERFDVTERTIYRDMADLHEMIPWHTENGRYVLSDTFKVKPVQFTTEEVLALLLAMDFGRRRPMGGMIAQSALDKLLAVLPSKHQELAAGLGETLVVDPLQAFSNPSLPEVEPALRQAVREQRILRLRYLALNSSEATERTIRPYGLAYRGVALYLIGYCELRQGIRTFRANRIQAVEVLPEGFQRPAEFDLEEFLSEQWGIEDGPMLDVQVRFSQSVARLAKETIWHPSQATVDEADGSVILQMQTRGKNELARWLAGYGGTVEVINPPELRDAVIALGQGIVERYR